jgi:hypothetical protein
MVWATVAAVVISAASSYMSAEAQKKAQKESNAALAAQEAKALEFLSKGKASALSAQKKGINFADESFQKALSAAGTLGGASRARVLRRGKQQSAAADAKAADRGLYDSTAALGYQRGVFESTNQALAGVDDAVAGLMTSIHQARGATALQGYTGMAQIESNFAASAAGTSMQNVHQAANVGAGYAAMGQNFAKLLMMYAGDGGGEPDVTYNYYN